MAKLIFNYLIFPGILFSVCVGLIAGWVDRKVTARVQWRKGPPWYQNFADIVKLFGKETIIPEGAKFTFLLSPFIGFLSALLVAVILGRVMQAPLGSFNGGLIVVLYLLVVPAIAMVTGASASKNPLASVGGGREMKLVLSYELPFMLAVIAVIIRSGGTLSLGNIINHQIIFGSHLLSLSGALAFIAAILCSQAKLGFVPFDMSEAEQEIMGGALIEYSGLPLAIFKLTKAVLLYIIPVFLIVLFWAKDISPLFLAGKYIAILVIMILIKNTNPRLRVDQASRFFLGPVTVVAIGALILSLLGY